VSGRRLDGPAPRLDADVGVKSYAPGSGYFYPSILRFPTVGCWRITATNDDARLVVTVRVVER
jgi:hypothetical protein